MPEKFRSNESLVTALTVVRDFMDEESAQLVRGYLCDPDEEVSRAAIAASAYPGNGESVPILFRLVEGAPVPIKVEAIRALSVIGERESVPALMKYKSSHILKGREVGCAILEAVNLIDPRDAGVSDLNHGVLMDEKEDPSLKERAVRGLVRSGDFPFLTHYIPHALPSVQEAAFGEILSGESPEIAVFLKQLEPIAENLAPKALGLYLCAYLMKVRSPRNNYIIEILGRAGKETHLGFLSSLLGTLGRISSVKRVFRILLLMPFEDEETEGVVEELLLRVVELTMARSPQAMSELSTLSGVYLDTLFNKVRKDHLSLKGVKERFDLLVVLFARFLERIFPESLVAEIQGYFKEDRPRAPGPLIDKVKGMMKRAGDGDRRRFESFVPIFMETERMKRYGVYSVLKNIRPENPGLLKRFHRTIKAVGLLKVRTTSKRIWEILGFAREERVPDLEATCVGALCRLGSRNVVVEMRDRLKDPEGGAEVGSSYLYGMRYLPRDDVLDTLLGVLAGPEAGHGTRLKALETLDAMDLSGMGGVSAALLKLLSSKLSGEELEYAARLLCRYADASLFQSLVALSAGKDPGARVRSVRILASLVKRDASLPVDVLTHRLYVLLRDPEPAVRVEALFALRGLGDDYALKELMECLRSERDEVKAEILSRLEGPVPDELLTHVAGQLESGSPLVHATLRRVLPALCRNRFCGEVREKVLGSLDSSAGGAGTAFAPGIGAGARGARGAPAGAAGRRETAQRGAGLIHQSKTEHIFRRENTQTRTVFFIDVVDYSSRSSRRDMSSLMQFVKTFEDTVIPVVNDNKGEIIKKLGDGMLAVFIHPLNAVVASLAIQERVRAHNQFALGDDRFLVRIGLHSGTVIWKEGDVFGDVVNLASRMQTAAQPGATLLTEAVYREVKDLVRCRETGRLKVKGFADEVAAYSPEELLEEVSTYLKGRDGSEEATRSGAADGEMGRKLEETLFSPSFRFRGEVNLPEEAMPVVQDLFREISSAVEQIAGDYREDYRFKRFLQDKWDELMGKLNGRGGGKGNGRRAGPR